MEWEAHYTRIVEAENFFDAVDKVKEDVDDIEEVLSINPLYEEFDEDI